MTAAQTVAANFSKLVTQLGTCLYDYGLPAGHRPDEASRSRTPSRAAGRRSSPRRRGCTAATQSTIDGWNVDNGRLRICGQSCDNLRNGDPRDRRALRCRAASPRRTSR